MQWPFPSAGDVVTGAINDIAKAIWGFVSGLLSGVFSFLDSVTQPTIVYTPDGPLGKVLPICVWLGLLLVIGLGFAQTGMAMWNGPKSLLFLLKGIGQYLLASAASLTVLSLVSTFAALCATGIMRASFNVNNWQGLSGDQTFMAESIKGLSGMALGIMSLLLVLPFGLGLLTEVLIREGAMEVLAATFPIVVAGLVHEKFARWYWTASRWMLALIFMLPLIALSMGIGHGIALAAGHVSSGGTGGQLTQAAVSGIVCNLSLVWPFALFKLFAFVDPNTAAGSSFRASMPSFGGANAGGGGEDTEAGTAEQEGTSDDGAGAGAGSGSSSGKGTAGTGGTDGGGLAGAGMGALQVGMEALRSFGSADTAASANDRAVSSLDGVGAGHRGGGGTPGQDDEDDNNDNSQQQDDGENEQSGSGGGNTGGDPTDPTTPDGGGDPASGAGADADLTPGGSTPGTVGTGTNPADGSDDPGHGGSSGGQSPGASPGGGGAGGAGAGAGAGEAGAAAVVV